MSNPFDEQARLAYEAQRRQSYWNRQAFKLIYVLGVMFVLPGVIIGGFACYLAIFEPEQFQRAIKSQPQGPRVDDLENPSFFIRQAALQKLVSEPPDRSRRDVAEKIKKLLSDHHPATQELAIDSLGDWGQPEDAAALGTLARDRLSTFVRPKICVALGKLKGEAALEALIDILGMGWTEQDQALRELKNFGPEVEPALLKRAETADPNFQIVICSTLQTLGTTNSIPFLEAAAKGDNPQVADAARKALEAVRKRG